MKRKVNIILFAWGIFTFVATCYIFLQGIRLEKKHVAIIELSEEVKSEVYQSQLERELFLLNDSPEAFNQLIVHLDKAGSDLHQIREITGISIEKAEVDSINGFILRIPMMMSYLGQIKYLHQEYVQNDSVTSKNIPLEVFAKYNLEFKKYESELQRYLANRNKDHKKASFALISISFIVLISSFLYISRLLKSLAIAERKLIEQTVDIEQKERQRVAADLHDGLGSLLSGINIYLKILEAEVQEQKDVSERIVHLKQLSDMSLQSAEAVINNLSPSFLSKYGLIITMKRLCQRMNNLGNIHFEVNAEDFNLNLSKSTELILYRILSELINNANKHSHASQVKISIRNVKQNVYVNYADNGIGINNEALFHSDETKLGLKSIISRIESLGGDHRLSSKPQEGVELEIRFVL